MTQHPSISLLPFSIPERARPLLLTQPLLHALTRAASTRPRCGFIHTIGASSRGSLITRSAHAPTHPVGGSETAQARQSPRAAAEYESAGAHEASQLVADG